MARDRSALEEDVEPKRHQTAKREERRRIGKTSSATRTRSASKRRDDPRPTNAQPATNRAFEPRHRRHRARDRSRRPTSRESKGCRRASWCLGLRRNESSQRHHLFPPRRPKPSWTPSSNGAPLARDSKEGNRSRTSPGKRRQTRESGWGRPPNRLAGDKFTGTRKVRGCRSRG